MLYQPEKISLLTRVKEQSFSGTFLALVLLANGRVDLSAGIDVREIRVLVFFLSEQDR